MSDLKKIRVTLEFLPGSRPHQMLEELKEERGQRTNPPILIEALALLHRKSFPGGYYSGKKSRSQQGEEDEESEEERLMREEDDKLKRQEAKEKVIDARRRAIAHELGGEIIEKGPGQFVVRYYQYSDRNRNQATVPLSLMDEFLVRKQYSPDKETVLKLQAEGKVNYKVE